MASLHGFSYFCNLSKLASMITIVMQELLLLLLLCCCCCGDGGGGAISVFKVCKLWTLWQMTILSMETRERPESHCVLMISLSFIRYKPCKIERD